MSTKDQDAGLVPIIFAVFVVGSMLVGLVRIYFDHCDVEPNTSHIAEIVRTLKPLLPACKTIP